MPTEMEFLQSQIDKVEQSLRLIEERKSEYTLKTDIPLDLIREEEEKRERLSDLRRRLEALSGAVTEDRDTLRKSAVATIKKTWVDRDEERRLFREMTAGQTAIHILLMEAETGMGKTILLDQFWKISEGFRRARVDFKQASYSFGAILREMCDQYGPQSFSMCDDVCCDVLRELGHEVKHAEVLWTLLDLKFPQSVQDRRKYQQLITDAFLANLESIREGAQPIVMLFDTFERASDPTKAWIVEQLITAIRRYPWLVCVVAGQDIPRVATDDAEWCLQHRLQPLTDEHSREYIQKVIYTQDESIVTYITVTAEGHPYTLQQLVLSYVTKYLPKIGGVS